MRIRAAEDADRGAIATVQTESWRDTYAEALPAAYRDERLAGDIAGHWSEIPIEDGDVVLVSEADERVVGFIAVWCRPTPFIDNLHVLPTARSAGHGAALMHAAARQLWAAGHDTACLWVVADNAGAIRFYERLGGVRGAQANKDLFGHPAPHLEIMWPDLRILANNRTDGQARRPE